MNSGMDEASLAANEYQESFERASADLEILCAAYPEEIAIFQGEETSYDENGKKVNKMISTLEESHSELEIPKWFPLVFTLTLPASLPDSDEIIQETQEQPKRHGANITMEFPMGYPSSKQLQIVSYRSSSSMKKEYIEQAANAVRTAASEAMEIYGGEECGLACCAAAIEAWNECLEREQMEVSHALQTAESERAARAAMMENENDDDIHWITAEDTLVDRRSVFQAHVCVVSSDDMVRRAVRKLIQSSNKIQRATHNMVRMQDQT